MRNEVEITMITCWRRVALVLPVLFAVASAYAHEDMVPQPAKVEKVYAAPKPLGQLRVTYVATEPRNEGGDLVVECDLFRGSVPTKGLADLPRPDWDRLSAAYSLTSYESGKWTERPSIYIQVPLNGPTGKVWQRTWVTFHFDADGKLIRRVKRFIPDEAPNSTRVVWKEWDLGFGVSAETLLEAAKDGSSRAGVVVDKELTKQIADILEEGKKITAGATRADLLTVFTTEGGLSNAKHRTFVHRRCPYIKVDVDFTLSDPQQGGANERPTDTVSKISSPYLAWSVVD